MRRSSALPVVVAAVSTLVLAGCTAGGSTPTDGETGPMTAFFDRVGGSFDSEDYDAQHRAMEKLVAECMTAEGFEYTPSEPVSASRTQDDDQPDWESREFAEQYGYGASTSDELYGGGEEDEWVDPNAEYLETMSESEQTAFYEALYGATTELDPTESEEAATEYNWEEAGCQGAASHEVYEQGQIWDDPAVQDLMDEMNTEYENLADDAVLRESTQAWADCMAEAGHDFTTPEDAQQSIYDELNAIYDAGSGDEATAEELESFEPDPAALAELKTKELALASADWACKDESGYTEAYQKAYLALETRLWEKYGDQLEALAENPTPAK